MADPIHFEIRQMLDASPVSLAAAAAALVLSLSLVATLRWATAKRVVDATPHAPNSLPFFKHTIEVLKHVHDLHDWTVDVCEQFQGRSFRMQNLGQEVQTIINTPELYEDVLKTQFECFDKGEFMCENLRDLLGNGIFAVDGVQWRHQRRTAGSLFTMRSLRESMASTVQRLLPTVHSIFQRSVGSGEPIDLIKFLNRFTMEAFAKIGFGIELGGLDAEEDHPFTAAFDSAQRISTMRFVYPRFFWKLLKWLQLGGERKLTKDIKVVNDAVLNIISRTLEARRESNVKGCGGKDIVSLFLESEQSDVTTVDPTLLRDIVVNFLMAGRDTTAQALSWFFYELSQNPHVEKRVRQELQTSLPRLFDKTSDAPPTITEVQGLTYLEATLKESLRLHPVLPMNFKRANRDTVLSDGTFIRKGSIVQLPSYSLARATHVWGPDAKVFRPERWLDPQNPSKLVHVSAFQFVSFHAGPRMCLGINLAMMEMKMLVASVLSKFQLEIVPGQTVTYDLSLTLPMKGQLLTRVRQL